MAASASLLKTSWGEFRSLVSSRWQAYAWTVALRFLLAFLLVALGYGLFSPFIHTLMASPNMIFAPGYDFHPLLPRLGLLGLPAILVALAGALIQFGFVRVVLNPKAQQTPSSIISSGSMMFWWTLLFSIVTGIILAVIIGLGTVAFILPGIYLGVMLVFSPFIVVLDGKGPIEAMKQSWSMVKGRWWSVFGTLLFWIVLTAIVMMVINGILGIAFHPFFDERGFMQLQYSMNEAAKMGNVDEMSKLFPQMADKILNAKSAVVFCGQMLVDVVVSIIPVYGFLSVYKVIKKMPKKK